VHFDDGTTVDLNSSSDAYGSDVLSHVPLIWEKEGNPTAPRWPYVMCDPRRWNQGVESPLLTSHFVLPNIVKYSDWLFHVRTNSFKSRFQLSQHFKISLCVNVCASRHEFWMRQAVTVPENLNITQPADGIGDALRRDATEFILREVSKPCTLLSSLVTTLFNNSSLSRLQTGRNCWLMSIYFCFSSRVSIPDNHRAHTF